MQPLVSCIWLASDETLLLLLQFQRGSNSSLQPKHLAKLKQSFFRQQLLACGLLFVAGHHKLPELVSFKRKC